MAAGPRSGSRRRRRVTATEAGLNSPRSSGRCGLLAASTTTTTTAGAATLFLALVVAAVDAATVGTSSSITGTSVTVTGTPPASSAGATTASASNGSTAAASANVTTTVCPPGYVCFSWVGPVGIDPRYQPDSVPSIIVTLLFIGGCCAGAVLVSVIANAVYNRYTAQPKVAPPPSDGDDDEGEGREDGVVKQTLLTRLGVMSWKADPIRPQDRFAKRAVLTWLRRVAARLRRSDGAVEDGRESQGRSTPEPTGSAAAAGAVGATAAAGAGAAVSIDSAGAQAAAVTAAAVTPFEGDAL